MPIIALEIKANLVNVTNLHPGDYSDHRWYLKCKCSSCGEQPEHWQYATVEESQELSKSHGVAHLLVKCPLCKRTNSLEILPASYRPYVVQKNEEWQQIVRFDCRGIEPVDFDPRVGWVAEGIDSGTVFEDIDLNEKEWVEYDEKISESVEINSIEVRFVPVKGK